MEMQTKFQYKHVSKINVIQVQFAMASFMTTIPDPAPARWRASPGHNANDQLEDVPAPM